MSNIPLFLLPRHYKRESVSFKLDTSGDAFSVLAMMVVMEFMFTENNGME